MTSTTRYGFYIGSTATGHRYISRAHLTKAMRLDPSIANLPVLEVRRSGTRVQHSKAATLDASNNPKFIVE